MQLITLLKKAMQKIGPLILMLYFLASCQGVGIKFDPNFHVGDHQTESIVDRNGNHVYSYEEKFNDYACMSKQKVMELSEILSRARIPKRKIQRAFPEFRPVHGR